MFRKWKPYITAAVCTIAAGQAWTQVPRVATLDIEWQNAVVYLDDLADPSKLVTSANPVAPNTRNFMPFFGIGDIVAVNGEPAKGSWADGGRLVQIVRNPAPGQAIGDLALRGGMVDIHLEILQADGTAVGSIMTSGFTGGSAAPGVSGLCCNLAVTGGTGAFQGVRGTLAGDLTLSFRPTSMAEDPANRRINGGTRGHFFAYIVPIAWPEIVTTASGPAVVHASDSTLVTAAKPAKSGEVLTLYATGLGPTRPALEPGKVFTSNPLQLANSPIEVTVGGQSAEVLYAGGYPGTADAFQVNFRLPSGLPPGMTGLQLIAAFIPGGEVSMPIQ